MGETGSRRASVCRRWPCQGDVILMLDYSNGDDDVVFRDVEGGNRGREDLGKKNKSH